MADTETEEQDFQTKADGFWNNFDSLSVPDDPVEPTVGDATGDGAVPASDTPPPPRADGRDPDGRFAKKTEENATSSTPPADGEAVQPPTLGETPISDGTTPPAASEPAQPFTVAFNGQSYEIPGSIVAADGSLTIPAEQVGVLHKYIGAGLKFDTEREQIKRSRAEVQQERISAQAETQAVKSVIDEMFSIAGIPDETEFAEKLLMLGLDLRQNLPTLAKERELSRREAQLQLQQQLMQPDPETVRAQITEQAQQTAQQNIAAMRDHPDFKGVMLDKDWQALAAKVAASPERYVYRVSARPTDEERAAGCEPGEYVFNGHALQADASERASIKREWMAEQRISAAAAKENAAKLARSAAPPPPAPLAAPQATSGGPAADTPKIKSRDDFHAFLNS